MASIRHMSRQVSSGSAGEYQTDEQAGVAPMTTTLSTMVATLLPLVELEHRAHQEENPRAMYFQLVVALLLVRALLFLIVLEAQFLHLQFQRTMIGLTQASSHLQIS